MNALKKCVPSLCILLISISIYANDTTTVIVDLNSLHESKLKIVVYPPNISSTDVDFIIPSITPGTYVQVNYHRFYSNFKAFDKENNKLKIKKHKNHFRVTDVRNLNRIEYEVDHSMKDTRIWDNTFGCNATIFKDSSFMLNYQLITGYFEGYQYKPIKIKVLKEGYLYGSTSLAKVLSKNREDVYVTSSYDELIDNPMLYHIADTASFSIDDARFNISVFSETGKINALQIKPKLIHLMRSVKNVCGDLASKNYHFIMYFESYDSLKGTLKGLGLGSALEHHHSSVYYLDEDMDTSFSYLNHIGAHEYLHTWAPLNIHSEKIEHFNFDEPDMSKHLWFYEGVTDYLATLVIASNNLKANMGFESSIAWALQTAINRKDRSMTKSSARIINHNIFDWIGKILQLENFYEKGKYIAFCLDMELYMHSDGSYRLRDLMIDLHNKYQNSNFNDDAFLGELASLTYPELKPFLEKYIKGKELAPHKAYFTKMGKKFRERHNAKIPSFGKFGWSYHKASDQFYISEQGKSTFSTMLGDTILTVNGSNLNRSSYLKLYSYIYYPKKDSVMTITVNRKGVELELTASPTKKRKIRYGASLIAEEKLTEEQSKFYHDFIYQNQNKSSPNSERTTH